MKQIGTLIIFLLTVISPVYGIDLDSLGRAAITHAAHHNIRALRPVYKQMGKNMPHFIKLYCDIAIASCEGRHNRVIECVDSLKQWYPKKLRANTLLSLAERKAESLRQLGKYEELKAHCTKEIKNFERRRFEQSRLKELYYYQHKATRLLGNSKRAQILQTADRLDIFRLDSLLAQHTNEVDDFTRLRSQLVLFHSFHQLDSLAQCAKELVDDYADSLDVKELTNCIEVYADLLIKEGKWQDLGNWTEQITQIERSHSANIDYYTRLSKALAAEGASEIEQPDTDYAISISYEWPLLVKANINNGPSIDVFLETEQAHTLVTKETAHAHNALILPDTLTIASSNGLIEVSPTLIKKFTFGEIVFKNLLVYTILDNKEYALPFDASLGTNEICRLGKITFLPEKMVVHKKSLDAKEDFRKGNLYMSEQNGLRIRSFFEGKEQPLSIDLGYPHNVLNKATFCKGMADKHPIHITLDDAELWVAHPTFIEEKIARCNGILGTSFLRSYYRVTMDFDAMRLTTEEQTQYTPARGQFGHSTDKFYLKRNKNALSAGGMMDEEEADFLELLLNIGKNRPYKVAEISHKLREKESPFYDAYTEAEGLFWNEQYKEAVVILEKVLDNKIAFLQLSPSEQKVLGSILRSYKLFENCQTVKLSGESRESILEKNKEGWLEIKVNGKKKYAVADLLSPYTEISAKYAKKLKVNILGTANGITHGIIPIIEIGGITIENAHCIVNNKADIAKNELPDKGKGLRIGWDLIRHFKQFAYSNQQVTFSLEKAKTNKKRASIHRLKNWIIETESKEEYPTYSLQSNDNISINPSDIQIADYLFKKEDFKQARDLKEKYLSGTVSIKDLLKKAGTITFDLENMELF